MERDAMMAQFRDSQVVPNPGLAVGDLFGVKGRVALVTGGSRGIGLMIAKGLVANGARVYISARKTEVCDRVAKQLNDMGPGICFSLPGDELNTDEACRALAGRLAEREGELHVLVNNAGATWGSSFEEFPDSAWGKVMSLNVASVFNLTRACYPLLKKGSRGSLDPSHVITVGSMVGHPTADVFDNAPSYAASKAAAAQVTRWLASKFCRDGIVTNCIQPAAFPSKMTFDHYFKDEGTTEMMKNTHPVGRYGDEADMVGLAIFLSSRASAFVTGETICLDGGRCHISGAAALPPAKL
jgi:NAD(P)-dependent dehydrogenase (short-subunit alcohol dehydrogenase family)